MLTSNHGDASSGAGSDGGVMQAMSKHRINSVGTVADSALTFEVEELKRLVEKKDVDVKRKDKEILSYQKEITRIHKEVKITAAEMQSLRERNEQLQTSLINSRLISQNVRDDLDNRLQSSRVKELESSLSSSLHKNKLLEDENETKSQTILSLQSQQSSLTCQKEELMKSEMKAVEENELLRKEIMTKEAVLNEKIRKHIENSTNDKNASNQVALLTAEIIEKKERIDRDDLLIKELRDELKSAKSALLVRSETNAVLRSQLEEFGDNKFNISKEEFDRLREIETDNNSYVAKNKDLSKSVTMYMDLLHKKEVEVELARKDLAESNSIISKQKAELVLLKGVKKVKSTFEKAREDARENAMTIEVSSPNQAPSKPLRSSLVRTPLGSPAAFPTPSAASPNMGGSHDFAKSNNLRSITTPGESDGSGSSANGTAALRKRITFLLEQLGHASNLMTSWREQKRVLATEIKTLHNVNSDLRQKLLLLQKNYMERYIRNVTDLDDNDQNDMVESLLAESNGEDKAALYELSGLMKPLPTSTESYIERCLFDSICAFISGDRVQNNHSKGPEKKKRNFDRNVYRVVVDRDGVADIEVLPPTNSSNEAYDDTIDATEMLVGLQIPAFLKFCSKKPSGKMYQLFVEKLVAILNHYRSNSAYLIEELSTSRIKTANLVSKADVALVRQDNSARGLSKERLAKQKMAMKYVREILKYSDIRVMIDECTNRAKDTVENNNFMITSDSIAAILRDSNDVLKQFAELSEQLSTASTVSGTSSGPVGSVEIRLPESQIDDETLYNVCNLMNGCDQSSSQGPATHSSQHGTPNGKKEMYGKVKLQSANILLTNKYLDRILLLNLRDNSLTDLSINILITFVEFSPVLRMLDLRGNVISSKGNSILFDSCRKNVSIVYVTQRQKGSMIEGHREITGTSSNIQIAKDNPKHPLRIDLRDNKVNEDIAEAFLESADVIQTTRSGNDNNDIDDVVIGKLSSEGIIRNQKKSNEVIDGGLDEALHLALGNSNSVRINSANKVKLLQSRNNNQPDGKGNNNLSDIVDIIERRKYDNAKEGGIVINGNVESITRIGSVIDRQIREMQNNEKPDKTTRQKASPLPGSTVRAGAAQPNMKLTVRERTLTRTKAVYSTTMKMPGDDEVDEFAGNRHLSQEPKKRPSSAILRNISAVRPMSAPTGQSLVRDKIINAKEEEQRYSKTISGLSATPAKSKLNSKKSAKSLMQSLQKLNPSVLFG